MKLFRRLSGKTPRPESFFSYLKYAAGEITLVVVGILIAVSLNNWNQTRKDAEALDQILATVLVDLRHDLTETQAALSFYDQREPIFERVLAGNVTAEDYVEQRSYAFLLIGYPQVSFQQRGFNQLKGFEGTVSSVRRELIDATISFYTERAVEISVDDKLREDDFAENLRHFKTNTAWWADVIYHANVDDFIPYALNDPDYRNRVAMSHFINYRVFAPELKKADAGAREIIQSIEAGLAER